MFFVYIDLPDGQPRISGVKDHYKIGEQITATCTSWHSFPGVNISWFINGEPVSEQSGHIFLHFFANVQTWNIQQTETLKLLSGPLLVPSPNIDYD